MDGSFTLLTHVDPLLLPAYSKPLPDELLSSWLARMAQDHGLHIFEFCNLCWPKVALFERDIDRNGKDAVLRAIAQRTNCSFEEVKATTLRSFEHRLYDPSVKAYNSRTKWVLPIGRESFKHKKKGLMFCPGCLQRDGENSYYRKKWRLASRLRALTAAATCRIAARGVVRPFAFLETPLGCAIKLLLEIGLSALTAKGIYGRVKQNQHLKKVFRSKSIYMIFWSMV